MLLAIDPGVNSPGAALFSEGQLVGADRVPVPASYAAMPDGQRWLEVARLIANWALIKAEHGRIYEVAFERPQWYAREKSKGDPNQLAGVAGVAAGVAGMLSIHVNPLAYKVHSPKPAEWIGQLSKVCPVCKGKAKKKCVNCRGSAWETPRGRYIRKRLSEPELALVPDQNDAIDAVGLGLWALGRLTPHTNFSNGRDGR